MKCLQTKDLFGRDIELPEHEAGEWAFRMTCIADRSDPEYEEHMRACGPNVICTAHLADPVDEFAEIVRKIRDEVGLRTE